MKLNTAKKGRKYEYKVRDKYIALGYVVLRMAASKGFADLIAINEFEVLFIQCKHPDKKICRPEREKLIKDNHWVGAMRRCHFILENEY